MSLAGKYLKYSPEITLEIFTLVWNKLIENGCKFEQSGYDLSAGINTIFKNWKTWIYIIIEDNNIHTTNRRISNLIETTVQEILGYDPFVKDFVLPEKWYVPVTDETAKDINIFKSKTKWYEDAIGYKAVGYEGVGYNSLPNDYTEITFEQFKQYVLKETIETQEKVTFEYVECIENIYGLEIGKIYHVDNNIIKDGRFNNYSIINNNKIKPSTKEAFDAQNQPKSIEKWSIGSYVVFLNSEIQSNGFNKGDIQQIREYNLLSIIYYSGVGNTVSDKGISEQIKWFATKSEAEEFAKTLVEPVKEEVKTPQLDLNEWLDKYKKLNLAVNDLANAIELANFDKVFLKLEGTNSKEKSNILYNLWNPKQPLKQAVHCKTQEEWDFVTNKLGYKWGQHCSFSAFSESTCISLIDTQYSYVDYLKNDYQILSFQEWCQQNGYKMEKEVKFEIGKWYWFAISSTNNSFFRIIKCSAIESDRVRADYWLMNQDAKIGNKAPNAWMLNSIYSLKELSIEEIQQYLPDSHPDKIKVDREFKVGDWVYHRDSKVFQIAHIKKDFDQVQATNLKIFGINSIRHATPEEINQHLISIGKIPVGEPLNNGIEPNKDGMFKYTTYAGTTYAGKTSTISGPLKMTLSIDDEELSMVSVIKTNSIKQLLNIE